MKRMWRTLSPRLSTVSTAALTVFPAAAVFPAGAGFVAVWACCMRIPSRHWEGDRYPADHVPRRCDEAHGEFVSLISDCGTGGGVRAAAVPRRRRPCRKSKTLDTMSGFLY